MARGNADSCAKIWKKTRNSSWQCHSNLSRRTINPAFIFHREYVARRRAAIEASCLRSECRRVNRCMHDNARRCIVQTSQNEMIKLHKLEQLDSQRLTLLKILGEHSPWCPAAPTAKICTGGIVQGRWTSVGWLINGIKRASWFSLLCTTSSQNTALQIHVKDSFRRCCTEAVPEED